MMHMCTFALVYIFVASTVATVCTYVHISHSCCMCTYMYLHMLSVHISFTHVGTCECVSTAIYVIIRV